MDSPPLPSRATGMRRQGGRWQRPLLILWLSLFAAAFFLPRQIEAEGSGFTRGTNRLPLLLGLHALAFVVALLCGGNAVRARRSELRSAWLGFVPMAVELVLLLLLVVVLLSA